MQHPIEYNTIISKYNVSTQRHFSHVKEIPRETEHPATAVESSSAHGDGDVLMSPAVRVLLENYQLNPRLIQATGPKGRLLKGDVQRYVAQGGKPFTKPVEEASPEAKLPTKAAPPQQTKPSPETTGRYLHNVQNESVVLQCLV